jgi:predicted RNA-binding protein with PIN domain
VGGGRAMDFGQLVAYYMNAPVVNIPTTASTCAAFSPFSVTYTKEGQTADAYIESLVDQIGRNYSVRVATSDSLVQLSSLRSGVLRMSARELWEEVQIAQKDMRKHF